MYVTRSSHGFIDERNQTRGSQFSSDWSTGSADVPPAAVLTAVHGQGEFASVLLRSTQGMPCGLLCRVTNLASARTGLVWNR